MKKLLSFILASAAIVFAMPASAQFAKAEDAVKYRQSAMFLKAQHMGRIGAMVNGRVAFDAKMLQENAEVVALMASLVQPGFAPGTDGGRAKPEIWKEQAKFKEFAEAGQMEASKLLVAAKTGNLDQIKAAFGPTASSCKQCHDAFQSKL